MNVFAKNALTMRLDKDAKVATAGGAIASAPEVLRSLAM